jgi:hypothetical protein
LWWWNSPDEGRRPVLREQWLSDPELRGELGIVPYRTDPSSLIDALAEVGGRSAGRLSSIVLPSRRQAIAVLRR